MGPEQDGAGSGAGMEPTGAGMESTGAGMEPTEAGPGSELNRSRFGKGKDVTPKRAKDRGAAVEYTLDGSKSDLTDVQREYCKKFCDGRVPLSSEALLKDSEFQRFMKERYAENQAWDDAYGGGEPVSRTKPTPLGERDGAPKDAVFNIQNGQGTITINYNGTNMTDDELKEKGLSSVGDTGRVQFKVDGLTDKLIGRMDEILTSSKYQGDRIVNEMLKLITDPRAGITRGFELENLVLNGEAEDLTPKEKFNNRIRRERLAGGKNIRAGLDLQGHDLSGMKLRGVILREVVGTGAKIDDLNWLKVDTQHTDFRGAKGVNLTVKESDVRTWILDRAELINFNLPPMENVVGGFGSSIRGALSIEGTKILGGSFNDGIEELLLSEMKGMGRFFYGKKSGNAMKVLWGVQWDPATTFFGLHPSQKTDTMSNLDKHNTIAKPLEAISFDGGWNSFFLGTYSEMSDKDLIDMIQRRSGPTCTVGTAGGWLRSWVFRENDPVVAIIGSPEDGDMLLVDLPRDFNSTVLSVKKVRMGDGEYFEARLPAEEGGSFGKASPGELESKINDELWKVIGNRFSYALEAQLVNPMPQRDEHGTVQAPTTFGSSVHHFDPALRLAAYNEKKVAWEFGIEEQRRRATERATGRAAPPEETTEAETT